MVVVVTRDVVLTGHTRALEMIARGGPLLPILDVLISIVHEQTAGSAVAVISVVDVDAPGRRRDVATLPEAGPAEIDAQPRWSTPILSTTGEILGAFCLHFHERRGPTPDERELVELLSYTAAIAIERQQAAEIALEADRRKDEFLAMLAHELRNPLAPIHTAAQLLAFADRDATIPSRARLVIERQVENMTRLIDDLLDVSRITRGMVELHKTPIDIAQLVARAVETAAPHLQKRGHRLTVSMPGGPMLVNADSTRLEQVIVNVLGNAAKFTGPGGDIAIAVAGEGAAAVTIRVTDNGRGIAPALLPRVFDMFTQGSLTLDRTDGGLGIGLTVAHRLVTMHGGSISVRSEGLGCGSEFMVTLPRTGAAAASDNRPPLPPDVQPRRILIVEDHSDAADMLALLLAAQSHQVRTESNGHAALVAATEFSPDVMLVDVGIPGMSGYDLAERVRSNRTLDHILLIAVTGYGRPQDRTRALTAGFDHHLIKPVDAAAIAGALADASRPKRPSGSE